MNLSKKLAVTAKKLGICEDWYLQLKNERKINELLDMYLKGIDFCLSNNFPSNDFIKENFKGVMEAKYIFLDEIVNIKSPRKVVLLGSCYGLIEAEDYEVCEVFIKDKSEIVIKARGNSFVMVDLFDDSKLCVYCDDDAKVFVNRYGGEIVEKSTGGGTIKVVEKNRKTY